MTDSQSSTGTADGHNNKRIDFLPVCVCVCVCSTGGVLYQEPKGRAILAEDPLTDGGNGVTDQRGDTQR